MSEPHSSVGIANYFLKRAWSEGEELTLLKLMKLVYISHGFYLHFMGKPLISEDVEAWKYGPVFQQLWSAFTNYGNRNIKSLGEQFYDLPSENGVKWRVDVPTAKLDNDESDIVDAVWDQYKSYDAFELSDLTHKKDSPWDIIFHDKQSEIYGYGNVIPNELIQIYYGSII